MNVCWIRHVLRSGFLIVAMVVVVVCGCASNSGNSESGERLATARAMFAMRCRMAGVKIYRTVPDVEGVYLLRVRPKIVNYGDQFALDDPYGLDFGGDAYIGSFLSGHYGANHTGKLLPGAPARPVGYQYVEANDPEDGHRYRYTGRIDEPWLKDKAFLKGYTRFLVDKSPAPGAAPRYGVTFEDISTREEREYWIAGSSLKVIDLQTGEVIGERVGYMIDVHQGSRSGGRSPWLFAADHACPAFLDKPGAAPAFAATSYQTLRFVEQVLLPRKGE